MHTYSPRYASSVRIASAVVHPVLVEPVLVVPEDGGGGSELPGPSANDGGASAFSAAVIIRNGRTFFMAKKLPFPQRFLRPFETTPIDV
jgi:hypothetical protein